MFFTLGVGAGAVTPFAASAFHCSFCRSIASSRALMRCTFSLLARPARLSSSILPSSASSVSTLAFSSCSSRAALRFALFFATSFLRCSLRCASPGANVCVCRGQGREREREGERGRKPYVENAR